jgi:hypothetical protein
VITLSIHVDRQGYLRSIATDAEESVKLVYHRAGENDSVAYDVPVNRAIVAYELLEAAPADAD